MADDERAGQGDGGGGGGALLGSPSHHVACFNGPAHTWVYGLIFRGGLSAIEDRRVAALHGPLEKCAFIRWFDLEIHKIDHQGMWMILIYTTNHITCRFLSVTIMTEQYVEITITHRTIQ
jgi:hypothetical protein